MEHRLLNFGIVGFGHIGRRHAQVILAHPECILSAVADVDIEIMPDAVAVGAVLYTSLDEMLAGEKLDIVCVCTPNGLHFSQALQVLEAGCHLVLEKPAAFLAAEVEQIIRLARRKNLNFFPVMQNRFSPPAVWLKNLIEADALGEVFMLRLDCFWNRDHRYYAPGSWHGTMALDGGTLYTQFSHFLDIMYWIFGDIGEISGWMANFNHQETVEFEDSGSVNFSLNRGGRGQFNFSTSVLQKNMESSLTLIAGRGAVKIGGQYMDRVEFCEIKDYEFSGLACCEASNDYGAFQGSAANHQFVIANVADVLQGRSAQAVAPADSRAVVDIISRIYAAVRKENQLSSAGICL